MENPNFDLKSVAAETLVRVREKKPLVLSLTNSVVRPITANLLLAVGAAPVMLGDASECAEMLRGGANALLINLGTLTHPQSDAMRAAISAARETGVPWVLDPVAVGALSFRTDFAKTLLPLSPTIIRGNASEILALAGLGSGGRGVESADGSDAAVEAARTLALNTGAAVLVTGKIDYATDGASVFGIANGNEMMTRVTGVGCSMGAFAAACAAVAETPLEAAAACAALTGIAGDIAAEQSPAPGTFAVKFIDAFYEMTPALVREKLRVAPVRLS